LNSSRLIGGAKSPRTAPMACASSRVVMLQKCRRHFAPDRAGIDEIADDTTLPVRALAPRPDDEARAQIAGARHRYSVR
jgi:hypothetical protein